MKLLTKQNAADLPAFYSQEDIGLEAIVQVKYFSIISDWTWYASEFNPDTGMFFGLVHGFEDELGYFSLAEFEDINASRPMLPPIERDMHWRKRSLADVQKILQTEGVPRP